MHPRGFGRGRHGPTQHSATIGPIRQNPYTALPMSASATTGRSWCAGSYRVTRTSCIAASVTAFVAGAIYLPAIASVGLRTDTLAHLRFAEVMAVTGRTPGPYYLFEQLTIIVRAAFPFQPLALLIPSLDDRAVTWEVSGTIVLLAFTALLAVILQRRLAHDLGDLWTRDPIRSERVAGVLAVCLLLVAPVTVLTWSRHQLLVGYINLTSFENATVIVSRPLSLLLLWVVAERSASRQRASLIAATAALSLIAVHAKPSFSVCLLPAAGVYLLLSSSRRQRLSSAFWWFGFVIPTSLGLLLQVATSRGQGGIGLAPFEVVRQVLNSRGLSAWWFLPLAVASMLFPAAVVVLQPGALRGSASLRLAWLTTIVGLLFFCLLEVTGRRDYGDLLFGPQIALFIVFVESVRSMIRQTAERVRQFSEGRLLDLRTSVLGALLLVHVLCGWVLWYHEVLYPAAWW